ncbi:uncharacterized protein AAG666_006332 [Megaptera novaeangliae]
MAVAPALSPPPGSPGIAQAAQTEAQGRAVGGREGSDWGERPCFIPSSSSHHEPGRHPSGDLGIGVLGPLFRTHLSYSDAVPWLLDQLSSCELPSRTILPPTHPPPDVVTRCPVRFRVPRTEPAPSRRLPGWLKALPPGGTLSGLPPTLSAALVRNPFCLVTAALIPPGGSRETRSAALVPVRGGVGRSRSREHGTENALVRVYLEVSPQRDGRWEESRRPHASGLGAWKDGPAKAELEKAQLCRQERLSSAGRSRGALFAHQPTVFITPASGLPRAKLGQLVVLCGVRVTHVPHQASVFVGPVPGRKKATVTYLSERWMLGAVRGDKGNPTRLVPLDLPARVKDPVDPELPAVRPRHRPGRPQLLGPPPACLPRSASRVSASAGCQDPPLSLPFRHFSGYSFVRALKVVHFSAKGLGLLFLKASVV